MIASGLFAAVAVAAGTAIPYRGVVEGFYGRPWGTEGRISMLKFMGERGLNAFVYGPKDDPYHREKWRESYPEREAVELKRVLAAAHENGVTFFWTIHLGGFKDGYDALFAKLESMHALGVRAFGVFFDDFGTGDAALHGEIGNRMIREFLSVKGDCAPLLVCPHAYWGVVDPYQVELGEKLDSSAMIMWTGRTICSDIRKADVEMITRRFRRPPFIWWNWPVNDYCRHKILLGRAYGIEACAYAGVVSNPMENCEASKVALHGFARWCADPSSFDSAKAWDEAFKSLYPKDVADAMRTVARHNSDPGPQSHGYRKEESAGVVDWPDEIRRIRAAVAILRARLPEVNPRLLWEIGGWLDVQDIQARIGEVAFALDAAKDDTATRTLLRRVVALKKESAAAGERARARFAEATFPADAKRCVAPVTATRELDPLLTRKIENAARRLFASGGASLSLDAAAGLRAYASFAGFRPTVSRSGRFVRMDRVMEPVTVPPGGSFGISIPKSVKIDSFRYAFDSDTPAKCGHIEFSSDGKAWERLWEMKGSGRAGWIDSRKGYVMTRYVNDSDRPVALKIDEFTYSVSSDDSLSLVEKALED